MQRSGVPAPPAREQWLFFLFHLKERSFFYQFKEHGAVGRRETTEVPSTVMMLDFKLKFRLLFVIIDNLIVT